MPFLGADGLSASAIAVERVYLTDIANTSDEVTIFCDSDIGNDNNNGYEATTPVKTLARACNELPTLGITSRVAIKLTGLAPHQVPDGFVLPPLVRGVRVSFDFADPDGLTARGPVRIYSPGVELLVLTAPDVVSITFPDASTLARVTVNIVLVPGAFIGKYVVDSNGQIMQIADNTATFFDFCFSGTPSLPFRIFSYGAVIEQAVPGVFGTIRVSGGSCPVILQGLQIQGGGFGFFPSVEVSDGASIFCQACTFEGIWINQDNGPGGIGGGGQLLGCRMERNVALGSGELQAQNCLFEKTSWILARPNALVVFQQCQFSQCEAVCFDANFSQLSPGTVAIIVSRILTALAEGVKYKGAGNYFLTQVEIRGSVGVGCVLDGGAGRALAVAGSLNAGGLSALNGAQVEVNAQTDINLGGGNELQVGSVLFLWAAFRPAPLNLFDVAIPLGQLARVWEAP